MLNRNDINLTKSQPEKKEFGINSQQILWWYMLSTLEYPERRGRGEEREGGGGRKNGPIKNHLHKEVLRKIAHLIHEEDSVPDRYRALYEIGIHSMGHSVLRTMLASSYEH